MKNFDDFSKSISNNSDIHGEGDDSHYEVEYHEDLHEVKDFNDIMNLNKKTRDLIKSFY